MLTSKTRQHIAASRLTQSTPSVLREKNKKKLQPCKSPNPKPNIL